ncbi:MAG TPA: TetR family transcriptional regulator [Kofleriaceae bacterium]
MPKRRVPATRPRKQPAQARSSELVEAILQAAIRVLETEGAARFTTIRVAEAAGVSVGSLYQYFPNKHAILFQLQRREWQETGAILEALLDDQSKPPAERLHATMRAFFRSECAEAPLRLALDEAASAYRDSPEAISHRGRSSAMIARFTLAAAPNATKAEREFLGELLVATMSSLGKDVSERDPNMKAIDRWAAATADMLLGYFAKYA